MARLVLTEIEADTQGGHFTVVCFRLRKRASFLVRPSQALLIGHPSVGIPSTGLLSAAVGHFVLRFVIAKNTEIGSSLHGAYVARQCPVRLFRERDPFETAEKAYTPEGRATPDSPSCFSSAATSTPAGS